MKKLFTLLLALVATTAIWAEDFEVDGIYYNILTDKTNEVEVTFRGWWSGEYDEYSGSVTIPSTVTYNGTTYSVTSIGKDAFYICRSLTSVTIPNSVTSIGEEAFLGCSSLTSITIPNSVTSIGDYAFRDCSGLISITIPNNVTTIGGAVFCGCSSLTSVVLSENMTSINTYVDCPQESAFCYSFGFFEGCSSLTSITIPKSVTSIGDVTFKGCSSLTSIIIPDNVTTLGAGLFYGCSSLESVVFSKNIQYIPSSHTDEYWKYFGFFGECNSLREITMMAQSPVTIHDDAFADIPNDIAVYVPCGSVSAYQSAEGWNYFTNIQEPLAEYSIVVDVNESIMGTAKVDKNTICGNQISATANQGYHFVQWSDGITDNPRTLVLTQDTAFTAEFAQTCSGQCGDDLYWQYADNTLTITGSGAMWDSCPWGLLVADIQKVSMPTGLTHIGNSAFKGCNNLRQIDIPHSVKSIGVESFGDCNRLIHINCYPVLPPSAEVNSFSNYNVNLYAPCDNLDDYRYDVVFGSFKYFECIGSEYTTTDGVTITPGSTDVEITWPTEGDAETYTIVIKKGDEVFCKLTFNKDGQLVNIAFAPGRNGNHPAQYAEQAANGGYRFTVTSLEEDTKYGYNLDVKNSASQTIKTYSGEFTTGATTSVEDIITNDNAAQKLLRDGQLIILRDGVEYNAQGQIIKE